MSGFDKIMQTLFGGSSQQSQAQSGPVDATAPDVAAFRKQLEDAFSGVFKSGGGPDYAGPLTASMSPEEKAQYDSIAAGGGDPTQGARQKYLSDTLSGNNLPGAPGGNPFLQNAIADSQRTTMNGLTDVLDRTLPGKFTAAGHFINKGPGAGSSPFDTAAAIATRGAADASASIATQGLNNAWNQGVQAQTAAAPVSQQEITASTQKLQDLALPRLIQDQGIDRGLGLFQKKMDDLIAAMSAANGVGNLQKVAQQSTESSSGTSSKGVIPGLLPKGLQGGIPG